MPKKSKTTYGVADADEQIGEECNGAAPFLVNNQNNNIQIQKANMTRIDSRLASAERRTTVGARSRRAVNEWKIKAKSKLVETCTVELFRRRLPIISWLPTYNWNCFLYDMVAGVTVGLTCIPQSIAYASIAGLPLQYGLYSAFMGLFVYALLGTVKEASIGPTAVLSLMTYNYASEGGPAYAALLAFLSGIIELAAGLLNLGFVVEFISAPVISGFCSAAALTVASTQVKGLFGLKFPGASFVDTWRGFFANTNKIYAPDAVLGCSVIVLLLLMRKMTSLKNLKALKRVQCLHHRFVDGFIWFLSTSRNAFAVIVGCLATYLLQLHGSKPFTLTGDIQAGLPSFALPQFSINRTSGNATVQLGFSDIAAELGATIGLIPLIAILEQVAIAKAFACGKQLDSTQEMIALGLGNILGSFFGSMPATASFGRSSVQSASGVKTPFANVYGGVLVLLALSFLMPSLAYIPKAILAAVIITSVIFLFEVDEIKHLWKSRRIELFPFSMTFFCCLFVNMEYGILIGAGVHLLLLAYMGNRPHPELTRLPGNSLVEERVVLKADTNLYFPGVEKFRRALKVAEEESDECNKEGSNPSLILDLANVNEIDFTALKMLRSVADERKRRNVAALQLTNVDDKVAISIAAMLSSSDAVVVKVDNDEINNIDG